MKVNMTPNPLDVVTIHASQGDTEARQWEFELHNNGELIDTSDITEQLFFKAYKGGTEQILPENGSTPTTSPIIADIQYPQGLLTDQEFLYRESPTEQNGYGKFKALYGNTLVWNQLIQNGNFEVVTGWATSGRGTMTVSNNVATITPLRSGLIVTGPVITITNGHKYLLSVEVKAESTSVWIGMQYNDIHVRLYSNGTNQWQRMTSIISNFANDSQSAPVFGDNRPSGWTASQIRNFMLIDLTDIFGAGKEPATVDEFTSLFPLTYYAYNAGTLLSFNGNGLKTVGFNQFNKETATDGKRVNNTGAVVDKLGQSVSDYIKVISGQRYYLNHVLGSSSFYTTASYDANKNFVSVLNVGGGEDASGIITIPQNIHYIRVNMMTELKDSVCVNISNTELNGTYEPYTSSITSLPISTYFPTGMKSAGTVYDELTESKATARLKETTFSSVSAFDSSGKLGLLGDATDAVIITRGVQVPNDKTIFETYSLAELRNNDVNGISQFGMSFYVRLQGKTTLAEYNTYLSANPLTVIYELATPTETSFITASLVTENAEIPLSNEDGVLIGKCTEQLSAEPGFHDAKIKLADGEGECYSNKIQLHVERSPQ